MKRCSLQTGSKRPPATPTDHLEGGSPEGGARPAAIRSRLSHARHAGLFSTARHRPTAAAVRRREHLCNKADDGTDLLCYKMGGGGTNGRQLLSRELRDGDIVKNRLSLLPWSRHRLQGSSCAPPFSTCEPLTSMLRPYKMFRLSGLPLLIICAP